MDNFNTRLRACMEEHKMNGAQVAKAIGTERMWVYRWLNGVNLPQLYYFDKLCNILEVSADYLLGRKGDG